jgi:peptide/nickel transport system substrate-binding protein
MAISMVDRRLLQRFGNENRAFAAGWRGCVTALAHRIDGAIAGAASRRALLPRRLTFRPWSGRRPSLALIAAGLLLPLGADAPGGIACAQGQQEDHHPTVQQPDERPEPTKPLRALAMHGEPALAFGANFPYAEPKAPKGGRLNLAVEGTFDSLNPFNLKAGSTVQGLNVNVFQTLMMRSLDEPFTLYGLIAESVETDADRSSVTFHLDPRARFSDGVPLTSRDVAFSFDLLKSKGRPQQRDAFSRVANVAVIDPLTISFDLHASNDRELPLTLALMPVLPAHHTDVTRFDDASLAIPIGSGPYVIEEVRAGERLLLRRDRNYWAQDLPLMRGLFNFDEIRIDYFRDANSLFEAFKAGLYDYRIETDSARWRNGYDFPAVREGRIVKETFPVAAPKGMDGFAFNTRRAVFRDVRVRQALSLMFDFEWINANFYGRSYHRSTSFFDDSELSSHGRPASARERQLLAPFPWAVRPDILEGRWAPPVTDGSGRDRNPAKQALALLAAAGFDLREGVLRERLTGEPLSFEIMVTEKKQERLALVYAQSLRRIGVSARVRLVDEVQYQRRRQAFDFDMMPGAWVASPSPGNEQRSRWGSQSADQPGSFNLAGVREPAVDATIAALLAASTHDDFVAAVRALDRTLLSGFYIVPFFYAPDQWVAHADKLRHPAHMPLFGSTIETWWQMPTN